ncbi:MAG: cation transporter [Methanosarcinaceae archaeon]|nr:cation transporter [Methanosarcinaceae archaeon]MDD4332367.1 cation transporter [Methanosarcinaceae archaeon]MDD4749264.1 cation transporter [Methanosarcinaceae archaeon]
MKIEGMACGHCVQTVKKAIEALEGVQNAEVDLTLKEAVVDFEEKITDLGKIRAAIKEAGYQA